MKKNNFFQRSLSAIILGPIFLFSIYWSSYSYFILFGTILIFGLNEFYRMFKSIISEQNKILGLLLSLFIYSITFFAVSGIIDKKHLLFIPASFLLFLIIKLYDREDKNIFQKISILFLGLLYLAVPLSTMHFGVYASGTYSYELIFVVIFGVWASDTGGYIFGSMLGKHKLFERISKNKTWEGVIGGILFSVFISYICSLYFSILSGGSWLIVGIIISVASVYGDLVESMLKRSVGVKDSGNIIPGHGGILDRFDSFLFAIVSVILYINIFS